MASVIDRHNRAFSSSGDEENPRKSKSYVLLKYMLHARSSNNTKINVKLKQNDPCQPHFIVVPYKYASNLTVDFMGVLVHHKVRIRSKSSGLRAAIEKIRAELRHEYEVREERRRELEYLSKGGSPLDFRRGNATFVSVQSTPLNDQPHKELAGTELQAHEETGVCTQDQDASMQDQNMTDASDGNTSSHQQDQE